MNSLSKSQKIAFIALLVAAIVLIAGGAFGVVNRTSASGEQMLSDMRLTALLTTAGEGSKEALIEAEIEAAREAAKAAGGGLSEIREAVAAAEAEATERVANMTIEVDLDTVDTSALIPAVADMLEAQRALGEQTDKDEAAYAEKMLAQAPAEDAAEEEILEAAPADAEAAMDMDMSEDVYKRQPQARLGTQKYYFFVKTASADSLFGCPRKGGKAPKSQMRRGNVPDRRKCRNAVIRMCFV